jgi:signal transduction histidine kinase
MDLANMLSTHREQVLERWTDAVKAGIAPGALPQLELEDHVPTFLDEMARALRSGTSVESSDNAAEHGVQRFRLGFSLDNVVHESQIGSGISIQPTKVRLRTLLEEVELSARAEAEQKRIDLRVNVDEDFELTVDKRLTHSALTNLVRNAVKFTHERGSVEVRAQRNGTTLTIEVEDSCGGLPPGAAEKAFVPFAQLGSDRSGFGLGLPIAKQAADAHGGKIRVDNLPGKGCIFALELPSLAPRVARG